MRERDQRKGTDGELVDETADLWPGKRSLTQSIGGPGPRSRSDWPGKRTMTEKLPSIPQSGKGGGSPLSDDVRTHMEASFGTDFSAVRVHQDDQAEAHDAKAFAHGADVHFAPGTYDPTSSQGLELIGHELAHVVQQSQGRASQAQSKANSNSVVDDSALEREADIAGSKAARGEYVGMFSGTTTRAVIQRKPAGGALIFADDLNKKPRPADQFTGPVTWSVLGDAFEVRLAREGDKLAVGITYVGGYSVDSYRVLGPHTATPTQRISTERRSPPTDRKDLAYNTKVIARGADTLTYDLFGDGIELLVIKDAVDPEFTAAFDRRTHRMSAAINGYPVDPAYFEVHLPTDDGKGKASGDREAIASGMLKLLNDEVTLRARRHGDSDDVVISLATARGEQQVVVPRPGGASRRLVVNVVKNDGRTIELDLDGDGKSDTTLVHTVRQPAVASRDPRRGMYHWKGHDDSPHYMHEVAAYDLGGVLRGRMVLKMPGYPGTVPPAQNAVTSPAPAGAAQPVGNAPGQDDVIGEAPQAIRSSGHDWELRIDGDGDRAKELLLRFIPKDPDSYGKAQGYTLRMTIISSGMSGELDFVLPAEQAEVFSSLGPTLVKATDGHTPGLIDLGKGGTLEFSQNNSGGIPAGYIRYDCRINGTLLSFIMPYDREPPGALLQTDKAVAGPVPTKNIAGVLAADIALTEYRDQFRVTVQQTGSDQVLFALSALQDGNQIGGLQTRLIGIEGLRLDEYSMSPYSAAFFIDPDNGLNPLNISSALDPPKDPQGRPIVGVPPTSHRDHRVSVWGHGVDDISATFPVRYGKFVPLGWEKTPDAKIAAGTADAVGVLQEQAKHPHLAEYRVQVDAALDAAITGAVAKKYISAGDAAQWTALKAAMVLIAGQASSGVEVDDAQVKAALASVRQVDSWLEMETNKPENVFARGMIRWKRTAPGATGPAETWTGTGQNTYTGATFSVEDSVLGDEKDTSITMGRMVEAGLRGHNYSYAISAYGQFRDGVRRWIKVRYERDTKKDETSAEAGQLDYLGKMSGELDKLGAIQSQRVELDASVDAEVAIAAEKGVISAQLGAAWKQLRDGMVLLTGQTAGEPLDKTLSAQCVTNTGALSSWLALETQAQVVRYMASRTNFYTGETQNKDSDNNWATASLGFGAQLSDHILHDQPMQAGQAYNRLRDGVVRWIAKKYMSDPTFKNLVAGARLRKLQKERDSKRDVIRIAGIYQADESFEAMPDAEGYKKADFGKYKTVPLTLFAWAEDGKWYIRDVTNPDHVWDPPGVDFDGKDQPPEALFHQLDHEKHLPAGYVTYQLPDGTGNKIRLQSKKLWYEYVRDWAMYIGIAAMVLLTGGALLGVLAAIALPLFVVGTAAAAMSVAADVGELVDASKWGYLDSTMVFMDVMDITVNLATLGAGGTGKLAMGAEAAANAERAGTGAAWSGFKAFAGKAGSLMYRPLMAVSFMGNALNMIVMGPEMIAQLAATDTITDPVKRLEARAKLIAMFAATSAMFVLSVHGDLPALGKGTPTIVLDNVNGRTVARVADVSIGKTHVDVPAGNANAHASARWQAEEIERTARTGSGKAQSDAAGALQDADFQKWYGKWLENPNRIGPDGKVHVPADSPHGYAERAQAIVDRGDAALHQQAFETADDVAKLRAEAGKLGLDIDPSSESWKTSRAKLEHALETQMGKERARTSISRYEAARLGAKGDAADFAAQRAKIGKVLPDTEVARINQLYEGHEVHVTGDLTTPQGAPGKGTAAVEIAVVVPNDTSPEVMSAMEQRAQGYKVLPEPEFTKTTGHETLELRVKVMTEDQFLGMATTSRPGKAAPRYVRLDQSVGELFDFGVPVRQHSATHYAVEGDNISAARDHMASKPAAEGRVGKIKYDPETNTAYFEVYGSKVGSTVRVEAALPARITGAGDWGNSNRIIGTTIFEDAHAAQNALRKVHTGDFASLGESVGVHPPPDAATTSKGIEFGVGELPDGRYVIVKGDKGKIAWGELPGVTGRTHTHPDVELNNLSTDAAGKQRPVSLVEIETPPAFGDPPNENASKVHPSGADVVYAAQHSGGHQGVVTPFVVQDAMVYKPGHGPELHAGVPPDARLEYEITGAVEVGTLGEGGPVVVRAEMEGSFNGKPVSRKSVWASAATTADPQGTLHLTEPEGVVVKKPVAPPEGKGGAGGGGSKSPSKPAPTAAEIETIKNNLTGMVKAQIADQKLPVAATPEVRVLPADQFEARFKSERGRAVFRLEGDKSVIYAHPDAQKLDIASEVEHVRQMQDPKMAAEIRILHSGALADNWKRLPAAERIDHFRRKLDLEIDATNHLRDKQTKGSPDHKRADDMLKDLLGLRAEVDSLTPTEITAMNADVKSVPHYLETPPWLFYKERVDPARPGRPVKIDRKDLVELPRAEKDDPQKPQKSTQYGDKDVDKVYQVGSTWKEHDDLHSAYSGVVTRRTGDGGKKLLVVTTESGVEHLYEIGKNTQLEAKFANAPDESIPKAQRKKVPIEAGDRYGADPEREYRWVQVEYEDHRTPKLVEEIRHKNEKIGWQERGESRSNRGDEMELAAKAQEDARLGPALDDKGHVKYAHLPSQDGRRGIDDIIVEFSGTPEEPVADLRLREVKDYPNKTVPYAEYTAITKHIKTNWDHIGDLLNAAEAAVPIGGKLPADFEGGFANMTDKQVQAVRKAFNDKRVKVELVLGPDTHPNPAGRERGVHDKLKTTVEAFLGEGTFVDKPTHVDQRYVDAERAKAPTASSNDEP